MTGVDLILLQKRRDYLDNLQAAMLAEKQVVLGVRNFFTPKQYIRECTVPKGVTLLSEIHKTEHPFFCLRGRLLVANQLDGSIVEICGGQMGITKAGTRRVVTALEETVFVTCHVTELTDIEAIGEDILESEKNIGQWRLDANKSVHLLDK